jgi:hypothetical protein
MGVPSSKRTRPGFGPAASEKYGSSIHSRERGVRASCFDDLGIVRRSFAPANAHDHSFHHNINARRITRFPFPSRSPTQHAQPTLRLPPFLPVHIRLLELKGISNRPRCAPVHDQGIHLRLVGDVQQIHEAYPELHSGNIYCGRLYGATKYAVQRHP